MRGLIAWQGLSLLDGAPIALIVTCLDKARRGTTKKANRKTGAMAQAYIIRSDVSPLDAIKSGADASVCGDCMHREGSCYVRVEHGPTQVYKAFRRGTYPALSLRQVSEALDGLPVRLGAYGDPSAVPYAVWEGLLDKVAGVTGYTHGWRLPTASGLKRWCMASCDSISEHTQASGAGWRTFTVVTPGMRVDRALLCPASEQAGKKLTCRECMACGGHSSRNRAHVYIPVHGLAYKQTVFAANLIQIGG